MCGKVTLSYKYFPIIIINVMADIMLNICYDGLNLLYQDLWNGRLAGALDTTGPPASGASFGPRGTSTGEHFIRIVNKIYFQMRIPYPIWRFICVTLSCFSYSRKLESVTSPRKQRTSALYSTILGVVVDGLPPPLTQCLGCHPGAVHVS